MIFAIHHVPGRLRIRNLRIKGKAGHAARYCDVVRCLPGVYAARASAVTGSVVIEYDPSITDQAALLRLLEAEQRDASARGEKLVEKLGEVVLQRLLERSATALIAALI